MRAEAITAAILVGGRARRLDGRRKPSMIVGGQTILDRQLDAIRATGIDTVLMVGPWTGDVPRGVRHVPDLAEGKGPLAGVYSALLFASTPAVVVLAGDMPFVSAGLLGTLAAIGDEDDAVIPRDAAGWHPLAAGYRRSVAGRLQARLTRGALRVVDALDDMRVRAVTGDELRRLDGDGMVLMNVNTPDDHRQAERRARRHP